MLTKYWTNSNINFGAKRRASSGEGQACLNQNSCKFFRETFYTSFKTTKVILPQHQRKSGN